MADHTEFVELALELINEEGREVKLLTISGTPADATKPWKGSNGAESLVATVKAVFVPPSGSGFGSEWLDMELFKNAEQIGLIAGGQGDFEHITLLQESDNTRWKVNSISRLKPADQTCLYAFGVAR